MPPRMTLTTMLARVALSLFELLARECNRYHALPSGGALGFVLLQVGGVSLSAVQGRLHYHDRGH